MGGGRVTFRYRVKSHMSAVNYVASCARVVEPPTASQDDVTSERQLVRLLPIVEDGTSVHFHPHTSSADPFRRRVVGRLGQYGTSPRS